MAIAYRSNTNIMKHNFIMIKNNLIVEVIEKNTHFVFQ